MTDRIGAFVVVLEQDLRDDDAQATLDAIRQIKGVLTVEPQVVGIEAHMAYERAREDLIGRIWKAVRGE